MIGLATTLGCKDPVVVRRYRVQSTEYSIPPYRNVFSMFCFLTLRSALFAAVTLGRRLKKSYGTNEYARSHPRTLKEVEAFPYSVSTLGAALRPWPESRIRRTNFGPKANVDLPKNNNIRDHCLRQMLIIANWGVRSLQGEMRRPDEEGEEEKKKKTPKILSRRRGRDPRARA
jgi:hypothetical protein